MRRSVLAVLVAAPLVLAGCGGDAPKPNTVAGCTDATIKAITTGDLADTNAPDYPECVGLSDADLMKAGSNAFADPAVKAYIADLVQQGTGAASADGTPASPRPVGASPHS